MNNTTNKKVSVIIPNYNSQKYIAECLDSVLNQDYPNIEIIVIDDGSTDNSLEEIAPYLDRVILITQKNQGACVARNAGLNIATGEYIKFLDSDDYLASGIITSQVNKLNTLDNLSIVFGDLIEIHYNNFILRDYSKINPKPTIESLILSGLITSLPLHRKDLLLKINGFDTRFKNWQEWNLHIRLAAIGTKFIYQSGIVYYWRFHDNPDRISNNYRVEPEYEINKRMFTLASIELLAQKTSPSINSAMSYSLWLIARSYYVSNYKKAAIQCYDAASQISSNINTYLPLRYKIVSFFIGNKKTESLILFRKNFTKFRKKISSAFKRY